MIEKSFECEPAPGLFVVGLARGKFIRSEVTREIEVDEFEVQAKVFWGESPIGRSLYESGLDKTKISYVEDYAFNTLCDPEI